MAEGDRDGNFGRIRARRLLPPFAAIRAFEAVGHLGGIRRAAEALDVDHAAVSRHLRALESWAGVTLVERGPGRRLTPQGAIYHARISEALEEISRAGIELTRRGEDQGLMIWCSPGLAYRWLNGRLPQFATDHPDTSLEVRPSDRGADLARHEADADIRYVSDVAALESPDIATLEISRPPVVPVAAPEVAEGLQSESSERLLEAALLHEADDSEWKAWFAAQGVASPARIVGPRLWHAHLTLDAARRGQGVALTNLLLLNDDLQTGRLVRIETQPASVEVRFGAYVFRARRDRWRHPPIVRFRRWLENSAARDAAWSASPE